METETKTIEPKAHKYNYHISSTQFFVLFCLCFFSPSTVFLPKLMTKVAGDMAWLSPIVGFVAFVVLFLVLKKVLHADGLGWVQKSKNILGSKLSLILSILVGLWCIVLSAFFVRHFAERVVMVYLSDASTVFITLSICLVVFVTLLGGMLSYARLCEVMFYFFIGVFVVVTALSYLDGVHLDNLLPIAPSDTVGILHGAIYMAMPFSILVYMIFFADRVNFDNNKLLKQGIKSSVLVCVLTVAVLILTIGQLGVFGVQYLQLPYFSVTRQIAFLGPLKNIGSIVFSLWILADFALIATLAYTATSIGQRIIKKQPRWIPISIISLAVALIAIFSWKDLVSLESFLDIVVVPISIGACVGIPGVLLICGYIRNKFNGEK